MSGTLGVFQDLNNIGAILAFYSKTGIVAAVGGGQTNATPLLAQNNEVSNVATAADSVLLPAWAPGLVITVNNLTSTSLQVFGRAPDTINTVATGTGVAQGQGITYYYSGATNTWTSSAQGPAAASGITATVTPFPIAGLAAAQGGAITITGGASSTSGNAGGAVSVVGGGPGATGVGGAVSLTGAIGGATSGNGGAASLVGGAGTNGNATGGAAIQTGGAGQGSAAGGAATNVGGAGGATGAGGAFGGTGGAGGATSGSGGAATITGGAGTNGNAAGGISGLIGGAGQGTGAGGASNMTGGASGSGATGNGGASVQTGGAALSTNGVGGAVGMIGGLGTGTQAGGAVTITSGAAGATGVAGAVNISVGAATAGAGSAVTITGGNGAGGTAAGGNVNIVPGTAVSTGVPGEFQVAGVSGSMEASWAQFVAANVPVSGTSYNFFMANRAWRVKAASVICSSTATVPTVDIFKDTGTTAPGGGTSVLTGVITFSATANTRVTGTLSATVATITLAAGDRLSTKWAGTVGSITGGMVSVLLVPA